MENNHENIKYCFICLTAYQYFVSNAYAKNIYECKGEKSLIINKYFDIDNINNEYSYIISIKKNAIGKIKVGLFAQISLFAKIKITSLFNKIEAVAYFNDRDPITQGIYKFAQKRKIRTILIEEGIGTYFKACNPTLIGERCVPDFVIVAFPELYKKYHSAYGKISFLDYKKIFDYKNLQYKYFDLNCDILFLGQVTPGNEELRNVELEFIAYLKKIYPKYTLLIKPHPRDEKYRNYITLKSEKLLPYEYFTLPSECIIGNAKIKIVASLFSSGCITLAKLFNQITVIYGFLLCHIDEKYDLSSITEMNTYVENLYIPKCVEDLKKININMCEKYTFEDNEMLDLTVFIKGE